VLKLKGLDACIGFTAVHPTWQQTRPDPDTHCGWAFYQSGPDAKPLSNPTGMGSFSPSGCEANPHGKGGFVRDLYDESTTKYTVPVLWDTRTSTIVSNESADIVRMLTQAFDEYATGPHAGLDLYPMSMRGEIDKVNDWVYPDINDGVYKCGFAKTQEAYDEAVTTLFASLHRVEETLSAQRYLLGASLTEADVRLFMTLVRFDEVYVVYFKCNMKNIRDFPHTQAYLRDLYQMPAMRDSVNMEHIKTHYFTSHPSLNPYAVIPRGPDVLADLALPHHRDTQFA